MDWRVSARGIPADLNIPVISLLYIAVVEYKTKSLVMLGLVFCLRHNGHLGCQAPYQPSKGVSNILATPSHSHSTYDLIY